MSDIDDILRERPIDLLLEALWTDPAIVRTIRKQLEGVSKDNLKYYTREFARNPRTTSEYHTEHTPVFLGNAETQEYVERLHDG